MSVKIEVLIEQNYSALQGYSRYLTGGNKQDSEDLLQDTLLKALKNQDKFDGKNFPGWAHLIMKNTFINNYRSKRRKTTFCMSTFPTSSSYDRPIPETVSDKIRIEQIERHLSKSENGILLLKYAQGFKYRELADEKGIPEGTVKTKIFHARKKI